MGKEKEIIGWFTVHGHHYPIYEGESNEDAFNRAVAKKNEDIKSSQIAKNKEQADTLNGKTIRQKNAEALGLDYKKEGEALIKEFKAKADSLAKMQYEYSATHKESIYDKIKETRKWLREHNKAVHEYKKALGDKTPLW